MVGFFIQRPIFASAIAAILVLAGGICFFLLPVSQFPEITPPQVVVSANYPGASAQVVADTVTTPLEEQINGVEGMTYMSSASSNDGSSTITVTFKVGYPLNIAAVDVQNRVSQAASSLPAIVNQGGVTIKKQNPNFVLIVNLISPDRSVDSVTLSNYAYLQIQDQLKRLPGVGDVQMFGERRYSMRVWLDPDKLANLGVTAVDVQNAIAEQNVQVAAGKIGQSPAPPGTPFELQVNAQGRLSDPQEFSNIIVRADPASGAVVRLRDVARVELGALQYSSSAFFGKDPTVVLAIFQMPGSNALDLQKQVKTKMEELSKRFPPGIAYAMHYDTTRFVSAAMHDVVITLIEALLLVVLVVFIFLQSWRATIIPTIAIPVSLIATLAVMQIFGFSLNMLSLLGMVLAIGLVVDDAIVVVENVERQLEAGLPPLQAARKAMSEVTGPIIATTAVLMAVFIPVAFIPGVAGRLYNQFALTVAISVGISAFNSLTLSPALSAAFLRHGPKGQFILFRWFNAGFDWLAHFYARAVRQFIRFGWALVAVFFLFVGGAYMLSRSIPTTFLPVEDQGYFFVIVQLPDGASLERTDAVAQKVRDLLQATPGVQIAGFISGLNFLTNAAQSNSAIEFAVLKPWSERGPEENASALVASVRPKLLAIPEAFALSFDPPSVNGLGTTGGFEFEVEDLAGRGGAALNDATQALIAAARKQPELNPQSLFTSFSASTPQLFYDLDRTKAKLLGLSLPDVFNTLQIYLGSLYVNDFNLFGHTFRVTVQADTKSRASPSDLSKLYVRNGSGGMIPLNALGTPQADRRAGDRAALQQLRFGAHQRRARAGLQLEPGGGRDGARGGRGAAARFRLRMDRRDLSGAQRRLARHDRARARHLLRVHDPRRAIRKLVDAVHGALVRAAGAGRRARRDLCPPDAGRRLFADRLCHADRACGEERHPDRRIRQAASRGRPLGRRGGDGGGAAAPAADPDDRLRLHLRRAAADVRERRGRGEPAVARHGRVRRHGRGDCADADLRARLLCPY